MMVLAGSEGFWKYDVAMPGPPGPEIPSIDGLGTPWEGDCEKLRTVEGL